MNDPAESGVAATSLRGSELLENSFKIQIKDSCGLLGVSCGLVVCLLHALHGQDKQGKYNHLTQIFTILILVFR